jgi:large subunit ribosomal protein L22
MEVKAHVRNLRMSARKVRLATDLIRGLPVDQALAQLSFLTKAAARPVKKLLESAIANATHNFKLSREGLFVQAIFANQGPTLKRWRPRAMGSAAPILKRSCHVTIVLGQHEVSPSAKASGDKPKASKPATKSASAEKPAVKKAVKKAAPTAKPAAKATAKKAVKK